MSTPARPGAGRYCVAPVDDRRAAALFTAAPRSVYRRDSNWTPPLPGEERQAFDPRLNPSLALVEPRRWVLLQRDAPVGRIAAFAPVHRPGVGYIGFLECPDDPAAAVALFRAAEDWLSALGRRECYGPVAVIPRDRIGLLIEGFDRPALLFTPYNPPYYARLFEHAGYAPSAMLRAYGWDPGYPDVRGVVALAERAARGSPIRIRRLRLDRLREETRIVARLINETLTDAWHFDPIDEREADQLALLLRPILDPAIALVAEDAAGPCGVALAVPDINWLWRQADGRLWPLGWARLLRWRRRIPQARLMAVGLHGRVRGKSVAARLIGEMQRAALARGYASGELSQIYEDNRAMRQIVDRMGLPVVRRYAVYTRTLER